MPEDSKKGELAVGLRRRKEPAESGDGDKGDGGDVGKKLGEQTLPLLPLNNIVGFPGEITAFTLQHEHLIQTVSEAQRRSSILFTYCSTAERQGDSPVFGTLARVAEITPQDGAGAPLRFKLEFLSRGEWVGARKSGEKQWATVQQFDRNVRLQAHEIKALAAEFENHLQALRQEYRDLPASVTRDDLLGLDGLISRISRSLKLPQQDRYDLLQGWSFRGRTNLLLCKLAEQIQVLQYRRKLKERTNSRMQRLEREAFLQEEKKLIESELGHNRPAGTPPEFSELGQKVEAFAGPESVKTVLIKEFSRLCRAGLHSPHAAGLQDYIEILLELPWDRRAPLQPDWKTVEQSLDDSHFGLEKVKRRVLQHLAVGHLSHSQQGAILCFVGPSGVGKTSMARAIAEALGLPFVKKSLGGVHDESEIRGHRRTYIGALPGRIIQGLRKVGCNNPLFLLDEVDKLGRDHRGSPADALLEVLDAGENKRFSDHYLELDFDLSRVFWVLTANSESGIPLALRDRLDVIHFSGYTEREKIHIAREYLLQRSLGDLGLEHYRPRFSESFCRHLIRQYTREAGVRDLERRLRELLQYKALATLRSKRKITVWNFPQKELELALGAPAYRRPSWRRSTWRPGLMAGLAWTWSGGTVLKMECHEQKGKGQLKLTGKLGEVMQESAHTATSFIRSHASELDLEPLRCQESDLHIHLPSGAVPKEGPSAGLGLSLLVYSTFAGRACRPLWAVTGEITLHGQVLPVGGIKEKILAAQQEGFEGVVLPEDNSQDVMEIPERDRGGLKFIFVTRFQQAYEHLFPALPTRRRGGRKVG